MIEVIIITTLLFVNTITWFGWLATIQSNQDLRERLWRYMVKDPDMNIHLGKEHSYLQWRSERKNEE